MSNDCLAVAFSLFTQTKIRIAHDPPYHIQEVIEELADRWTITEISAKDIDASNPFDINRVEKWMQNHSGVVCKWTPQKTMHAWAWYHKAQIVQDETGYALPKYPYSIFWIVSPRLISEISDSALDK